MHNLVLTNIADRKGFAGGKDSASISLAVRKLDYVFNVLILEKLRASDGFDHKLLFFLIPDEKSGTLRAGH